MIQSFQKFFRRSHPGSILLLILVLPLKIFPETLAGDPVDLLRAGRWGELQRYFRSNRASSDTHRYILGRAMQEKIHKIPISPETAPLAESLREPVSIYLGLLGLTCDLSSQMKLNDCIHDLPNESVTSQIPRLAILKLSAMLHATGWNDARLRLLSKSALREPDPLTAKIYTEKLEVLLAKQMNAEALELAGRLGGVSQDKTHFYRARAYIRAGRRDDGWNLYLLAAARSLDDPGLLRSIFQDLKYYFPAAFRAGSDQHSLHRSLFMFYDFLTPQEKAALASAWPAPRLLETTSPQTTLGDGNHLISIGDRASFQDLAKRSYTAVSREPLILYKWGWKLTAARRYAETLSLIDQFDFVKKENAGIWRLQLDTLEAMGDKDRAFRETLAYLAVFDYDLEVHDSLIEFLIGSDDKHIHWAKPAYWELARGSMPPGSANGRFVYWLRRMYLATGETEKAKDVERKFYEMAPGSYYARAFWDEMQPGDFRRDWQDVRDRPTYLRWIGRHGGNPDAIRFLAARNLSSYFDPRATALWQRLQSVQYSVPEPVVTVWKLGEFDLGAEYFDYYFKDRMSRKELFLRKVMLGLKSGHLDQSVWHLRQLARDENIPEDPFSIAPDFLKQLYPRPYLREVRSASSEFGLSEDMIYALMRQESMFRELAVSRSGALGLMQVMPATGRWLAPRMQMKNPDMLEPSVSIRMGGKFFADLLRSYDNDFRWASIAYNGGPGSLARWKAQYYHGDFNLFLENIPSKESRNYCRVTFQNYMHYRTTYTLYP